MPGFHVNLEDQTVSNNNFRHVLYTGPHSQLVLMSLDPGEEIGLETHPDNDQFFRVDSGEGKAIIDGVEYPLKNGDAVVINAGSAHNILNNSTDKPLKLYTIYSPAHHPDGTIHATKADAQAAETDR